MATDISKLGVKTKWQDLTEGMIVAGAGTSKDFHTGEWTSVKPEFIEDKCKLSSINSGFTLVHSPV